jgi:two-component system, NarL family, sensor histidine kinase UhpB
MQGKESCSHEQTSRLHKTRFQQWRFSLFEKVILANSVMLIGEALAGFWVTSHNLEAHHYLIDTGFIVLATLLSLLVNFVLLRASFRPLFSLLATIRAVTTGKTDTRAAISSDLEISELAAAFNTMLDRLEAARREQALLILQAHEEERRRIARELHDETSQNLTALLVHAEILSQALQRVPEHVLTMDTHTQLESGVQQLVALTQYTLESTRVLAQRLRPSVLDDLGFFAALRWLVEDSRRRLRLTVQLYLDDEGHKPTSHPFPAIYETTLFRIAQECLTNTARHAHASGATITLRYDKNSITLKIADDGCGFDPSRPATGLGILGMRERANLLGGTLTIHSSPADGTIVQAVLPMAMSEKQGVGVL